MKVSTLSRQPDGRTHGTPHGPGTGLSTASILEFWSAPGAHRSRLESTGTVSLRQEPRVRAEIVRATAANPEVLVPAVEPVAAG